MNESKENLNITDFESQLIKLGITNDSIYLGIPFSTSWFTSILNERSAQGREDEISILEGNYLEEFSFLKEGLPNDAIALVGVKLRKLSPSAKWLKLFQTGNLSIACS